MLSSLREERMEDRIDGGTTLGISPMWGTVAHSLLLSAGHPINVDHAGKTPLVRHRFYTFNRLWGNRRPCGGVCVTAVRGSPWCTHCCSAHTTVDVPISVSGLGNRHRRRATMRSQGGQNVPFWHSRVGYSGCFSPESHRADSKVGDWWGPDQWGFTEDLSRKW